MTICIEIVKQDSQFNGTAIVDFDDFTWEIVGEGANFFRGTGPDPAIQFQAGIFDFFELLDRLAQQFGPFVDIKSEHAGTFQKMTDVLLERAVAYGGAGDLGGWEIGTHSADGFLNPTGNRLRELEVMGPTESAETFQAGGSAQVSNTSLADGQAGSFVFPSGMRCYVDGGAVGEPNTIAFYLQPYLSPRMHGDLALAGEPPPQFGP